MAVAGAAKPVGAADAWPGTAWASTSPERVGLDPARLGQGVAYGKARAVGDERVALDSRAARLLPTFGLPPESNRATGWLPLVTLRQFADHGAGFDEVGGFEPLVFRPGTAWAYSNAGANWLADVLTATYRRDLAAVLRERVLTPLQTGPQALNWRPSAYCTATLNGVPRREFASGIYASVDAMARVGLMAARGGRWKGRQILPAGYTPPP